MRLVAIEKLHTFMPEGSARSSGSRVRFPKRITLLMYIKKILALFRSDVFKRFLKLFFGNRALGLFRYAAWRGFDGVGAFDLAQGRCLVLRARVLTHGAEDDEAHDVRITLQHFLKSAGRLDARLEFEPPEVPTIVFDPFVALAGRHLVRKACQGRSALCDE